MIIATLSLLGFVLSAEISLLKVWEYGGCFKYGCNQGWYLSPIFAKDENGKTVVYGACENFYGIDLDSGTLLFQNPVPIEGIQRTNAQMLFIEKYHNNRDVIVTGHAGRRVAMWYLDGTQVWEKQLPMPAGCNNSPEVYMLAAAKLKSDGDMYIFVGLNAEWSLSAERSEVVQLLDRDGRVLHKRARGREDGFQAGIYHNNIGFFEENESKDLSFVLPDDTAWVLAFDSDLEPIEVDPMFTEAWSNEHPAVWGNVPFNFDYQQDYISEYTHPRGHFTRVPASTVQVEGTNIIAMAGAMLGDEQRSFYFQTLLLLTPDRKRLNQNFEGADDWRVTPQLDDWLSNDNSVINTCMANVVPVDLDGNQLPEFVFPDASGHIHAFSISDASHEYGNFPYRVIRGSDGTNPRFASEVVVFQRDGEEPIIAFSSWGKRGVSTQKGLLHFIDSSGTEIHVETLPDPDSTSSHVHNGAKSAPTLWKNETSNIFISLQTITSGNVLYEILDTENANILWETGRGSYLRQGRMLTETQTGEYSRACFQSKVLFSLVLAIALVILIS